jgi:hypothetical protein
MFSTVVPAGTVGGSVSITAKDAEAKVGLGSIVGFASKETAMIAMAVRTAADPYFKVHFSFILFLPPSTVDA